MKKRKLKKQIRRMIQSENSLVADILEECRVAQMNGLKEDYRAAIENIASLACDWIEK